MRTFGDICSGRFLAFPREEDFDQSQREQLEWTVASDPTVSMRHRVADGLNEPS